MDDHQDNGLRQEGIDFQRIAVTEEQIEEFNLPSNPKSKETIDKVNHETRKDATIYGRPYIVELDARLGIGLVQERIRIVKRHYLGSMMAL